MITTRKLKAGDFIEMNYGAMHPKGLIVIHGIAEQRARYTPEGAHISSAHFVFTGTRLDTDVPQAWTMDVDRDGDAPGIGSFKKITAERAGKWMA